MCGIVGFAGAGNEADIRAMQEAVCHRGPDSGGVWYTGDAPLPLHFGFRRLIVVDPEGGSQPMVAEDGDTVLVYNGEVYNAAELRRELESEGLRFRSDHSDAEVLLRGYQHWGRNVVDRLSGMFAFVVYDRSRETLFGARDPFGKKPLFYSIAKNLFAFGSELSAVTRHSMVRGRFSRDALKQYFAFGFVPAPRTIHEGVEKLEAGHWFEYDLKTQGLRKESYWSFRITGDAALSEREAVEETARLFDQAVSKRLQSDVTLGALLSGGLDSSSVVAFASRHRRQIETFSLGFESASFDETHFASLCARHLGTKHHTGRAESGALFDEIRRILGRMDEPIADPSLVPTFMLSRFAREHVTVVLSGDGGDELFAGYDTFLALRATSLGEKMLPAGSARLLATLVERLPVSAKDRSWDFRLRRFLRGLGQGASMWHPLWLAPASAKEIAGLFGEPVSPASLYADAAAWWDGAGTTSLADRAMEFYCRYYLSGNLLTKVDRASMLNSLEVRCPFLDRDLTSFVTTLPANMKLRRGVRKWLLRQVVRNMLPPEVLHRPKKGFGVPLVDWFSRMAPPDFSVAETLDLDADYLRYVWKRQVDRRGDHRGLVWAWLSLSNFVAART